MKTEEQRIKHAEYMRAYRKTDKYRGYHNGEVKRWNKINSLKRKAHLTIGNGITAGKIVKPDACVDCGANGIIHGHHPDYSKPLEVEWLCEPCHRTRHKHLQPKANQ